jgi:hypothetical protein
MFVVVVVGFIPTWLFEKYTYLLYLRHSPDFFTFSGWRLMFDIMWFLFLGVFSALIVGRGRRISALTPFIAAGILMVFVYFAPLCATRECYVSSPDRLAPSRDFLFFGSLGFLTATTSLSRRLNMAEIKSWLDKFFAFVFSMLLGYTLSYFLVLHIFAGVTLVYPLNYLQWFIAAGPPSFAASLWVSVRSTRSRLFNLICGLSGILLGVAFALELPCVTCTDYGVVVGSIFGLATGSSLIGVHLFRKRTVSKPSQTSPGKLRLNPKGLTLSATVSVASVLVLILFFIPSFEASVVDGLGRTGIQGFSSVEVGHAFVYSGGYLSIPRVTTPSVGVSVSFANTSIPNTYKNDFLAAGVGVQSPNCCKDGLDLSYREDAAMFGNGTEEVLARAWWSCDLNVACGGYSWEQLIFFSFTILPVGTLSKWVDMEMNWTVTNVHWYYRISNDLKSYSNWTLYSSFTPPSIQNHYFDAGLYYTGPSNPPIYYALFYQFGVSSGYAIPSSLWRVFFECPRLVANNAWNCISSARFVSGSHSYWKLLYSYGLNFDGVSFTYLGNYTVEFYYSGRSPPDGAVIW